MRLHGPYHMVSDSSQSFWHPWRSGALPGAALIGCGSFMLACCLVESLRGRLRYQDVISARFCVAPCTLEPERIIPAPATTAAAAGYRYIRRYFSKVQSFSVRQLLPSGQVLLACGLVSGCLAASNAHFMAPQQLAAHGFWRQAGLHVGVGVCLLAVLVLRIARAERATIAQVSGLRRKQE
jgi:hypothetical protein